MPASTLRGITGARFIGLTSRNAAVGGVVACPQAATKRRVCRVCLKLAAGPQLPGQGDG